MAAYPSLSGSATGGETPCYRRQNNGRNRRLRADHRIDCPALDPVRVGDRSGIQKVQPSVIRTSLTVRKESDKNVEKRLLPVLSKRSRHRHENDLLRRFR